MGLFKLASNAIADASKKISTGSSSLEQEESQGTGTGIMGLLMGIWASYGTFIMIAAALFIAWKWILPMLGLRKKSGRRGNPGSLARARRAKARKSGRL